MSRLLLIGDDLVIFEIEGAPPLLTGTSATHALDLEAPRYAELGDYPADELVAIWALKKREREA